MGECMSIMLWDKSEKAVTFSFQGTRRGSRMASVEPKLDGETELFAHHWTRLYGDENDTGLWAKEILALDWATWESRSAIIIAAVEDWHSTIETIYFSNYTISSVFLSESYSLIVSALNWEFRDEQSPTIYIYAANGS